MSFNHWRPHPWHGLPAGDKVPELVNAYIEMTPFDVVKYEIDKATGYLRVDRPQRSSSHPPMLYGFVPRTYCGDRVKALSPTAKRGDQDPLDICVLSERPINRSEVILSAKVVGGIQMIDDGEADDKIIAVLANDTVWSHADDVSDLPEALIERLRHYFATYKLVPGEPSTVTIEETYGRQRAFGVVQAAIADYESVYAAQGGT